MFLVYLNNKKTCLKSIGWLSYLSDLIIYSSIYNIPVTLVKMNSVHKSTFH